MFESRLVFGLAVKKSLRQGKVGFMHDGKDRCGQISCTKVTPALRLFSTR